ncbi:MAG: ABC transporter substrate-binding protein [Desulfobacterales bacterium]|nr:ABC transporter substrate-binding protein [Desulfobacterales bacterium]
MKVLSCVTALIIGICLTGKAYADELQIGFAPEKPPFIFATKSYSKKYYDLKNKQLGIQIDVVTAALEGSEYTFKPYYAPNKRIIKNVRNKVIDAGEMAGPRYPDIFYSGTIIEFKNYAVTRKSENLQINSIEDLRNLKILAWQGAKDDLGGAFAAVVKGNPSYYENPSLKNQCAMFFAKRAQVIIIDKNIFLWWKKELSSTSDTTGELAFHPIFPGTNKYTMGFSSKKARDIFDKGLQRIKDNGTYDQIFKNYLE